VTLLGDSWLNPGPGGIALPFTMAYRPLWTGSGIIAGWLAALLGLTFYLRRWIGARLWRRAHRLTVVGFGLAIAHTIGAGTDSTASVRRSRRRRTSVERERARKLEPASATS
jgi:sulfoxide reductase heme-binding subunit YedZ